METDLAGTLADCFGLSLEDASKKELEEEVGGTIRELQLLGSFFLRNGYANHRPHFFVAFGVKLLLPPAREAVEHIRTTRAFSAEEIAELILDAASLMPIPLLGLLLHQRLPGGKTGCNDRHEASNDRPLGRLRLFSKGTSNAGRSEYELSSTK